MRGKTKDGELVFGTAENGDTILHCAVLEGKVNCIEDLLQNYKIDPDIRNSAGSTALHVAVEKNKEFCIEPLITNGANVNSTDSYKQTPLHRAAGMGREQCLDVLIKHKADLNQQDNRGEGPLHVAAFWGQHVCVEKLIKKRVDVTRPSKWKNECAYDCALKVNNGAIAGNKIKGASSMFCAFSFFKCRLKWTVQSAFSGPGKERARMLNWN